MDCFLHISSRTWGFFQCWSTTMVRCGGDSGHFAQGNSNQEGRDERFPECSLEMWRWSYKRDTFRTGGLFSILGKLFVNSLMQAKQLYHSNHSITQFDTIYINHLRYQFLAILPAGGRSLFWNGPWASLKWLALEEKNPGDLVLPRVSIPWL